MISDTKANKKLNPVVTELFMRDRELNMTLHNSRGFIKNAFHF